MKAKYTQEQFDIAILKSQQDTICSSLERLEKKMDEGFSKIEKRFEKTEEKFEKIDERFDAFEKKLDKRFDEVESKFDRLESKIDSNHKWTISMIFGLYAMAVTTLLGALGHAYKIF